MGVPKGILISHEMILYGHSKWWNFTAEDVLYTTMQIHSITWFGVAVQSILNGVPRVLRNEPITGQSLVEMLTDREVTIMLTSSHMIDLIHHYLTKNKFNLDKLVSLVATGSKLNPYNMNDLTKLLPNGVCSSLYGMTETCSLISGTTNSSPPENSVGKLYKGISVQVLNLCYQIKL